MRVADAFEQWRLASGLVEFDLIGHSFGGFLCGHYAHRYSPVRKLILMSSWGVPALEAFSDKSPAPAAASWPRLRAPPVMSLIAKGLLNLNFSPLSIVRAVSVFSTASAQSLVRAAITRRLGRSVRDAEEMKLIADYIFAINVSGRRVTSIEQSFSTFMDPAIDRWPSSAVKGEEIGFYAVCPLEGPLRSMRPEVSFVYGDRDWMRSRGADRVAREIGADVHTIENAGHLMYIENYEHFNSVAASILQR